MWTVLVGVAGLDVELARALATCSRTKSGSRKTVLSTDALAGRPEEVERPVRHELDADLGRQTAPSPVEGWPGVFRQHVVTAACGCGTSKSLSDRGSA
jgi:hypothetical protein